MRPPRPTKPTNLSTLEDHLGFWLRYVSNHVSGRFEKQLAQYGITVTEWVALRTLYEQPETRHAALIDALGMTKGAASKVITKLESKGLAQRRLAEDKAREQILLLTSAGRQLVPKLARCADDNDDFFFGHLKVSERAALMNQMKNLVRHHQLKEIPVS